MTGTLNKVILIGHLGDDVKIHNFEGGGCRFIRQNKTVNNKDIGSVIIHPGKITHYHEGLAISAGKRYILVSFIN